MGQRMGAAPVSALPAGAGGVKCLDCGAHAAADGTGRPIALHHTEWCPSFRAAMPNLVEALVGAQQWVMELRRTGGPDLATSAHKKVAHEGAEFGDDPSLEEAADVLISLAGSIAFQGWRWVDVIRAVNEKMTVNRGRTWAELPDGTWQHT